MSQEICQVLNQLGHMFGYGFFFFPFEGNVSHFELGVNFLRLVFFQIQYSTGYAIQVLFQLPTYMYDAVEVVIMSGVLSIFFLVNASIIRNGKTYGIYILLFVISLYILNFLYLLMGIALDFMLYFVGKFLRRYLELPKITDKYERIILMYGKWIPVFGYFVFLRLGFTQKRSFRQVILNSLLSLGSLIFGFSFLYGLLAISSLFYREVIMGNPFDWWQKSYDTSLFFTFLFMTLIGLISMIWIYKSDKLELEE